MNIDALLTSKDPDELRSLALKLLADLEQQTQRNQSQTCYIPQLEEALKTPVSGASGVKAKPSRANSTGCSTKISRPMPPISSSNWRLYYPSRKHQNRRWPNASPCRLNCPGKRSVWLRYPTVAQTVTTPCASSAMKSANGWNIFRPASSCTVMFVRSSVVNTARR